MRQPFDWPSRGLPLDQEVLNEIASALKRIEEGLVKRGAGFAHLRRLLLQQEEAHHTFGQRTVERAIAKGETSFEELRARAPVYLVLTDSIIRSLTELFESIDEDPATYISDARNYLPRWFTPGDRSGAAA